MIPENTYIKHLTHALIRTLGDANANLAATIVEMCESSENGEKIISLEFLASIFGKSERTIQRQLAKLQMLQVIVFDSGLGKGNCSKFRKGDNFDTFSEPQKATNFVPKDDKSVVFDNKDIIKAASAHAQERMHADEVAAADGELKKGSPRQKKEDKKMIQELFEEFWSAFKVQPEYENRKTRCEGVWAMMPADYRTAVVKELKSGKKHRANPLHYLQYYTPADVKPEFPIFRNGDASLSEAIREAETGGRALAFVRAGATLHIPDNFAHIYLADALAQKIKVIRTTPAIAMLQVPEELKEKTE